MRAMVLSKISDLHQTAVPLEQANQVLLELKQRKIRGLKFCKSAPLYK
jgi:hypothetical protein